MQASRRSILWLALGLFTLTITHKISPASPPAHTLSFAPDRRKRSIKTSSAPPKAPPPLPSPSTMAPSKRWFTGDASVRVISRGVWADAPPIMDRMLPMGPVSRITLHHEGWNPVRFTDVPTTAERLELIRRSHINRLKSGDIGYHFIIDRAGRVWQGRQAMYQGAHVRSHNENNIGVMCLGNFDVQSPTPQQIKSLVALVKSLRKFYKVPGSKVKTHQEINPTHCPGKTLQAQITKLRKNKSLA